MIFELHPILVCWIPNFSYINQPSVFRPCAHFKICICIYILINFRDQFYCLTLRKKHYVFMKCFINILLLFSYVGELDSQKQGRRRFTLKQKMEAIKMVEKCKNVTRIASRLSIPRCTLIRWRAMEDMLGRGRFRKNKLQQSRDLPCSTAPQIGIQDKGGLTIKNTCHLLRFHEEHLFL